MSEVTDDHSALNAAIDAIDASDTRTSYGELTRSLRSIAQSLKLPLDVHLYSDMQQSGMPTNFNDLRLNAAIKLEAAPHRSRQRPQFRRGKRGRAAACVRRQEGPRARHGGRLRHAQGGPQRHPLAQRAHRRNQVGRSARERPRHRGVPVARRALRPQQGRGQNRFGRLAARRRHLLLLGRARRSAPRPVRQRPPTIPAACCTSGPRSKPPASRPSRWTRWPSSRPPT